jgi:hypothetical protein
MCRVRCAHCITVVRTYMYVCFSCRFSHFKVMKNTGNVFSGVWEEEHIRTNASSHAWIPLTQLQMEVLYTFT